MKRLVQNESARHQTSGRLRCAAILFLALGPVLFGTGRCSAQVDQGSISGNVRDSSGAAIPAAKVTLVNTATGFSVTVTTDARGNYTATPLKLGSYTVKADAAGFATATQNNVQVNVSSITTANLQVAVSGAQQDVTVSSAPPALQSEEASTGQVISAQIINNTPLNGRNFTFIAQLSAGVAPAEQGARGANKWLRRYHKRTLRKFRGCGFGDSRRESRCTDRTVCVEVYLLD